MLSLCKTEMMYWNSVSTFGALLQFQYHSCEEKSTFKGIILVLLSFTISNIPKSRRTSWSQHDFHCAILSSMYRNSVSTFGALLQFQYHCCEEIVYFSRDFSTTFIQYIQHTEVTANQWSQTDAFIVQDWNRCTESSDPLLGHFFNFSTTAVKR